MTYLVYALLTPYYKLGANVADILAALCVLSPLEEGSKLVLEGTADLRVRRGERFRFESFVGSLGVMESEGGHQSESEDRSEHSESIDEEAEGRAPIEGLWEYRTAGFSLINAITNGPGDLQERILLRDEFSRRGLNEIIAVRRPHS